MGIAVHMVGLFGDRADPVGQRRVRRPQLVECSGLRIEQLRRVTGAWTEQVAPEPRQVVPYDAFGVARLAQYPFWAIAAVGVLVTRRTARRVLFATEGVAPRPLRKVSVRACRFLTAACDTCVSGHTPTTGLSTQILQGGSRALLVQ